MGTWCPSTARYAFRIASNMADIPTVGQPPCPGLFTNRRVRGANRQRKWWVSHGAESTKTRDAVLDRFAQRTISLRAPPTLRLSVIHTTPIGLVFSRRTSVFNGFFPMNSCEARDQKLL